MSRLHPTAPARSAAVVLLALACPTTALAHGFAGDRFFPATILTDDPFVADEMSLPTLTRNPTGPDRAQEIDLDVDIAKRLTPNLGVSLSHGWKYLQPKGAPAATGLDAFSAELDYQFFTSAAHEATAMVGLDTNFAHTGRVQALGSPDYTTLSPLIDFGKGFGDLPDSVSYLRPFAVTGNLSFDFPTKGNSAGDPIANTVNYGFALEYSLEYLQHHVRDVGLVAPFDRMIPLVEFGFTTAVNRGQGGQTVGTIQPGLIWSGQYMQIGAEAIIPINRESGRGFGGVVQVHFYLDDIFPATIGRPLFGS